MLCETSRKSAIVKATTKLAFKNISPYHQCPKSMNVYLFQTYNISFGCLRGSKANLCNSGNPCNSSSVCCQLSDGCKKCVGNLNEKNKNYLNS